MKGAASADAPSVRTRARWSKPRSPSFAAVAERGPRLVTTTPVLVLPGYGDSGPEHWQSLWQAEDPACRRGVQRDWMLPRLEEWLGTLASHVAECEGPPVLGAHSRRASRRRAMIRKLPSGKYRLYSRKKDPRTGRRRNLGTFATRAAALKHERAVQFFKRH